MEYLSKIQVLVFIISIWNDDMNEIVINEHEHIEY